MNLTVLELLRAKLPEEYVVAVISNMQDKRVLDEQTEGFLLDELQSIFDWQESNEGWLFWTDVHEAIEQGLALPILPIKVAWRPNTYISTETGSYIINLNGLGQDVLIRSEFSLNGKDPTLRLIREQHFAFCN